MLMVVMMMMMIMLTIVILVTGTSVIGTAAIWGRRDDGHRKNLGG